MDTDMVDPMPCVTPQNHEWLKILVSTLAGLLAGVLAEPLNSRIHRSIIVRRVYRAITVDFMNIFIGQAACRADLVKIEQFWAGLALPAFEHYWAVNPEVFYGSWDMHLLRMKCEMVVRLKQTVSSGSMTTEAAKPVLETAVNEVLEEMKKKKPWVQRALNRYLR